MRGLIGQLTASGPLPVPANDLFPVAEPSVETIQKAMVEMLRQIGGRYRVLEYATDDWTARSMLADQAAKYEMEADSLERGQLRA